MAIPYPKTDPLCPHDHTHIETDPTARTIIEGAPIFPPACKRILICRVPGQRLELEWIHQLSPFPMNFVDIHRRDPVYYEGHQQKVFHFTISTISSSQGTPAKVSCYCGSYDDQYFSTMLGHLSFRPCPQYCPELKGSLLSGDGKYHVSTKCSLTDKAAKKLTISKANDTAALSARGKKSDPDWVTRQHDNYESFKARQEASFVANPALRVAHKLNRKETARDCKEFGSSLISRPFPADHDPKARSKALAIGLARREEASSSASTSSHATANAVDDSPSRSPSRSASPDSCSFVSKIPGNKAPDA